MAASITGGLINFFKLNEVVNSISSVTSLGYSTITKAADFGVFYFANKAFGEQCTIANERFKAICDGTFDSISCFFTRTTADMACLGESATTAGMGFTFSSYFIPTNWIGK